MCLIAFNWNNHPTYKLILIANRDEFYHRKTRSVHFWEDNPNILAGKDLEAGGTWMGVSKKGKFTALTNYRDIANLKTEAPSRGMLTMDYLNNGQHPKDYLAEKAPDAKAYNGFNLLTGTSDELFYFSNYENKIRKLESGLYGLSNHLLNTPWYKVEKVKQKLSESIQKNSIDVQILLNLLNDPEKPEDSLVQQTGLPMDKEKMLSSMFIESPDYGTRCSSVLLIDYNNHVSFTEKIYSKDQEKTEENTFELDFE